MDLEKNNQSDFILDEKSLFGQQKKVSAKTTPKDIVLNALSAVLVMAVVMLCNLFITDNFEYHQLYNWNFGLLVVINWVCGIMMTYFLRKSGINSAKLTPDYIKSEDEKQAAFSKIEDYHEAQKVLNRKIEEDFDLRRSDLENAIAKLVKPKMPKDENGNSIEWHIGDPLPKKTHIRVRIMEKKLARMTPPVISLVSLAQSEATYNTGSLYEVKPSPERTGSLWFVKKGSTKVGWFAVAPVVLSLLSNGLAGGITIGNIVSTIGIIAVMLFNAAREYSNAYASVAHYGVDRNRQIVQIINSILKNKKNIEKKVESTEVPNV